MLSSRMAAESLVASLGRRIRETLTPLLQGHRTCALVGFPSYANVGDSAIWLGQEAFLRDSGLRVVCRCDATSYSARRLSTKLDRGVILLSGGGNLGDLYPDLQRFREVVIQDFPEHKVIQLPQSIHFIDPRNRSRARAIFNAHPDLTLMVRDQQSLEIARNEFRTSSLLCPDMALALGRLVRPTPPAVKIVWLARSDREAKYRSLIPINQDVERFDWIVDAPSFIATLDRLLTWLLVRYPRRVRFLQRLVIVNYRRLAMARLARGLGLLARGRVVISDRLHGCILSLLMGVPYVALDNTNGKVKAFHATWTELSTMTHWAESPEDALQQAVALEAKAT
jgi:exopolysaccharide biosynthesis predicted pyruvyltransferase EpsI